MRMKVTCSTPVLAISDNRKAKCCHLSSNLMLMVRQELHLQFHHIGHAKIVCGHMWPPEPMCQTVVRRIGINRSYTRSSEAFVTYLKNAHLAFFEMLWLGIWLVLHGTMALIVHIMTHWIVRLLELLKLIHSCVVLHAYKTLVFLLNFLMI
jgi:hypothetical protein